MRLFLLIALAMLAFAANSILNRFALAQGAIDPGGFALLRLASGGLFLWGMVAAQGKRLASGGVSGVLSLAAYMLGFSFAYISLDTGVGALILFGGVQITMFAGALLAREHLPWTRWCGALVAFVGLVYLLWPTQGGTFSPFGVSMMVLAAIGWGVYSLIGKRAQDPLATTAGNFVFAIPLALAVAVFTAQDVSYSTLGIVLAVISGVVTSGMGYALWYAILPRIPSSVAAIAMLTVPVLASLGGVVFLSEAFTLQLMISTILVIAGVLISLKKPAVAVTN
ncbi:DMT family transporter [Falsihalocynthiibacter sp. SS001]|uniref:DMT family transporter n=1 Tax=Falsihalocynthiibacter sp. SS001 TaxID=3349698 RepID=UPI0036D23764